MHRKGSSTGYFGFFGFFNWFDQYRETLSDMLNPSTVNNHGRIFLGYETFSNEGAKVYVSSAVFSIEDELHDFVSFDDALNQFNETDLWKLYSENLNVYKVINNTDYSTFDHKRVKTFILK